MSGGSADDISDKEFSELWDRGLGRLYCNGNPDDLDVTYIPMAAQNYYNAAIVHVLTAGGCIIGVFFVAGFALNLTLKGKPAGMLLGALLISCGTCLVKSFRFLSASRKLKRLDLSGFDLKSYEPAKRNLKRKSMAWGISTQTIVHSEGRWRLTGTPSLAMEPPKDQRPVYLFAMGGIVTGIGAVVLGIFLYHFFFGEILPKDLKLTGKAYRINDVYAYNDLYYDKKTHKPATGTILIAHTRGKGISRRINMTCELKQGRLEGVSRWYSDSGTLVSESMVKDGIRDGRSIRFNPSGQIEEETFYEKGVSIHGGAPINGLLAHLHKNNVKTNSYNKLK